MPSSVESRTRQAVWNRGSIPSSVESRIDPKQCGIGEEESETEEEREEREGEHYETDDT